MHIGSASICSRIARLLAPRLDGAIDCDTLSVGGNFEIDEIALAMDADYERAPCFCYAMGLRKPLLDRILDMELHRAWRDVSASGGDQDREIGGNAGFVDTNKLNKIYGRMSMPYSRRTTKFDFMRVVPDASRNIAPRLSGLSEKAGTGLFSRREAAKCLAGLTASAALSGAGSSRALAQAEFYRGKTFRILVAAAPGAAYDFVARALAASIARHIPGNPTVVVQNMFGAASLVVMNSLYNEQPQDGTVIGLPLSGILLEPRLKLMARQGGKIGFDLSRMSFVGSPTQQPQILWVWHKTPFQSAADLTRTKARMGATSFSADNYILPTLSNAFLGTILQAVTGYTAVSDIFVAGESGELDGGTCNYSSLAAKADWMREKDARILIQFGAERAPYLPDVPTAVELAKDDVGRHALLIYATKYKAAYPFIMTPGVPPDRVATIRAAFMATMKDPQFIADATRLGFDVDPLSGEDITKLMSEIDAAPQDSIDQLKKLLG